MAKKWFQKAVYSRPPYNLGGWKKSLPAKTRRRLALLSRPKNWTLEHKYLSVARALTALANVTKDAETKATALVDALYFRKKYYELKGKKLKKIIKKKGVKKIVKKHVKTRAKAFGAGLMLASMEMLGK